MSPPPEPMVVAAEMGYGHLRPARSLALHFGAPLLRAERAPLCDADEARQWDRIRGGFDLLVRASQMPLVGTPFDALLRGITEIPTFHPRRDLRRADFGVRGLRRLVDRGLGAGMVEALRAAPRPLVTTFYAPAIVADAHGLEQVYCIITDTDCARVWVPADGGATRIHYFAPSDRVRRRLEAYGVPPSQIHQTGFPLPPALVGGDDLAPLRRNLALRLRRLDPKGRFLAGHERELDTFLPEWAQLGDDPEAALPPLLTYAVGGSGAQVDIGEAAIAALADALAAGRLRLGLVAGIRAPVRDRFVRALERAGLGADHAGVELVYADSFDAYAAAFDGLLARSDALWTKTSEMSFYAALGLPIVMAPPVGIQEHYNRRWLREAGAGIDQRPPRDVGDWIVELLHDGLLARAAWTGFLRLPKQGTAAIAEVVRSRAGALASAGASVAE